MMTRDAIEEAEVSPGRRRTARARGEGHRRVQPAAVPVPARVARREHDALPFPMIEIARDREAGGRGGYGQDRDTREKTVNFLQNQAGKVYLFRQRVPIRNHHEL